jgi:hypothetical protein
MAQYVVLLMRQWHFVNGLLYGQFGAGFLLLRKFLAHFKCLELALAAYPDARVSVGNKGITLRPSRPAIAKL